MVTHSSAEDLETSQYSSEVPKVRSRNETLSVTMFSKLCAIVVFGCAAANAYTTDELLDYEDASDPRLFFTNFTSGDYNEINGKSSLTFSMVVLKSSFSSDIIIVDLR